VNTKRNKQAFSCRCLPLAVVLFCGSIAAAADWTQFRGAASNSSVAADNSLPTEWSKDKNVAWQVELPGRGPSSPIVVGGRVIVTASSGVDQDRLHVLCFSAKDGKKLWERQFWATGRTLTHPTSANAANTPASDGKLIFAFYSSNDLVCLDLEGNVKWLRGLAFDYPTAGNDVGLASSPVVLGDTVVVQIECQGESFAAGIDKHTGLTKWRVERDREAGWCSPIVMRGKTAAEDRVLVQSANYLTAHDPATGKEVWRFKEACNVIPSAAADGGVVYVPAGGMTALRPADGTSEPSVLWKAAKLQPASASPIVSAGRIYTINRAGVVVCADAASGEILSQVRLQGSFWGTPALVGDRLYCISQEGLAQVVEYSDEGRQGEVIGKGEIGETIQASPAVANGALYLRSDRHLWKIAQGQ
jgi:outer membrane protein assembly factor BamB